MATLAKRNFSGGELDPALHGSVDLTKYQTGLKTCLNTWVKRSGGLQNRPGTRFCGEVKSPTKFTRIIPFVFNNTQAYAIEMGEYYFRFIVNGSYLKEAAKTITGITQANPGVVTSNAHGYSNGQDVYISGIVGMTELNGRTLRVAGVTANTFTLTDFQGNAINTTGFTAYSSGGTAEKIYTVGAAYEEADLNEINYAQSADVLTLVHENYAVQDLERLTATTFSIADKVFGPSLNVDAYYGFCGAATAGATTVRYQVTVIDENGEESAPLLEAGNAITGITNANPPVVTHAAIPTARLNYVTNDIVYLSGIGGMTELNDGYYTITVLSATTFSLNGVDATSYGAFTAGGYVRRKWFSTTATAAASSTNTIEVKWDAVANSQRYSVYCDRTGSGVFGYLATVDHVPSTTQRIYIDIGAEPDYSDTPPEENNPFDSVYNYPRAVGYTQQRLVLAGTVTNPETVWTSRTGQYSNFNKSFPIKDDDSVEFTLQGRTVNNINHLLEVAKLIVFTEGGEWSIEGGTDGAITPSTIGAKQHTYNGTNRVAPIVVDGSALYVQARGTIIRDLAYTFETDGYRGNDISIFAAHLFEGKSVTAMAYQQSPNSIAWVLRDDGVLLGCTYIKEQQIIAWHRHETDGVIESICVIPEGDEDVLYMVVQRTIDDVERRFVERMDTRLLDDQRDMVFMDSVATYDGRNTGATTMTISGGTTWDNETLTVTASASFFKSTDVGNEIQFFGADDGIRIDITITGYTSATVVTGTPSRLVPTELRSQATTDWAKAVDTVSGLHHLLRKRVSIFADGYVIASPNNPDYETFTVDSNGIIELDVCYAVISVGLPYLSDVETLDIDTAQSETLMGKQKITNELTMKLRKTRGLFVGPMPPEEDTGNTTNSATYGLTEAKLRQNEHTEEPIELFDGDLKIPIRGKYSQGGRVFIRQVDPLPMEINAIAARGSYQEGR